MANPPKRKGTGWESETVDCLHRHGFTRTERRALSGVNDKGDIAGLRSVVIEDKAEQSYDLPRYLRETEAERVNADACFGFAWLKLRGKARAEDGAVIMSGRQFVEKILPLLEKHGYV